MIRSDVDPRAEVPDGWNDRGGRYRRHDQHQGHHGDTHGHRTRVVTGSPAGPNNGRHRRGVTETHPPSLCGVSGSDPVPFRGVR